MGSFCLTVPEIMGCTYPDMTAWQIGTTRDAVKRQADLGQPACFCSWSMDEFQDAADMEAFMIKLGMLEPADRDRSLAPGCNVYIYRKCGAPKARDCAACPHKRT